MRVLTACLAAAAFLFAAAPARTAPAVPVREGTVLGPEATPQAEALVAARPVGEPASAAVVGRTDEAGRFRLTLRTAAPHAFRVESAGLAPHVRDRVAPGQPLRITLVRGGFVEGVVRDGSGAPVPGALVEGSDGRAREMGLVWHAGFGLTRAITDGQGRFRLSGVGPGPHTLTAAARGRGRAQRRAVRAGGRVDLVLLPSASVTGGVAGPDGRPAAGALVLLEPAAGSGGPGRLVVTDGAGRFELLGVDPGQYRVVARHETLAPAWQPVVVKRHGDTDASLRLGDPSAVTGRLVDAQGRPIHGRVGVLTVGDAAAPRSLATALSAETATDGRFRLAPLPTDSLALTAAAERFASRHLDAQLTASARELDLGRVVLEVDREEAGRESVLQETGGVTGVVVDASGAPVTDYQVVARPQPSPTRFGGAVLRRDVETTDGRFTLEDLAAGTYVVTVVAPEREPAGISNVVVGPARLADVGEMRLSAGGTVRGTVVDATGAAVAGAMVRAALPRRMIGALGTGPETGADATGAFELRGVSVGSVRITARHPEYAEGEAVVDVDPARGAAEAQLVLHRGGRIHGQARHRDGSAVRGVVAIHRLGVGSMPFAPAETVSIAPDGTFAADHVPAGRARLVLMTGPALASGPEREVEVAEGATTSVAFDLREVLVAGRVTRGGAPAAGLRMIAHGDGPMAAPFLPAPPASAAADPSLQTALTREDGSYELIVDQPGPVRITLQTPDGSVRLPARTAEIPDVERHILDLDFGGLVLAGIVVDEHTDRPLARAAVLADPHGELTQGKAVSATTAADGRFQLEVEPGRYRVTARVAGYAGATTEVEVQTSNVSDLRLPLPRGGTVRGRVVDPSGRPAGDGIVRAFSSTTPGTAAAPLLPDGRFELSGLMDAEYAVVARSDAGGFALRAGVPSGTEDVTLVLRRGGRIQLKLVDGRGAPVAGASASVLRVDGVSSPGIATSSTSDGDGFATLLSPTGAVELRVARVEGGALVAAGSATVLVEEGSKTNAEVLLARPTAAWQPE